MKLGTLIVAGVATLAAGCSSDDDSHAEQHLTPDAAIGTPDGATDIDRPEGPAARVAGLLIGGNGINLAAATPPTLPAGWVEEEYALEGTAVSYASDGALPGDGMYELHEDASADYRTRVIVRRPGAAADFNGTVVVEWLNVSSGMDANPDYTYLADELTRGGYAWIGVSAQFIGIEGGEVLVSTPLSEQAGAGQGLRALDPARYGELHHPGDAFAYDIYTQVARALRVGGDDGILGDLVPTRLLAAGESQSGFMLTTYVNGVHPLVLQYDAFFVHSRGGGAAPLGQAGSGIDLVSGIASAATRIRTDVDQPILIMETETDLLSVINYYPARQDDTDRLRSWEIAGTAHADAYQVGGIGDALGCLAPINDGPQHFVAKAALRHLDAWSRGGEAAPAAPRLQIGEADGGLAFARDENGNALGGIRTPQVDVPVDTLSGDTVEGSSILCMLFGFTSPLSAERLAELYASPDAYLDAYTAAADAAIEAGFVLEEDRDALLADADPSRIIPW